MALPAGKGALRADTDDKLHLTNAIAKLGQEVHLSHFQQRTATPLLVALQLFHPWMLVGYAAHWLSLEPTFGAFLGAGAVGLICVSQSLPWLGAVLLLLLPLFLMWCLASSEKAAPLVMEPRSASDASAAFLANFVSRHHEELKVVTDTLGAVLFRGFRLHETGTEAVEGFEQVLGAANMKPTDFFGQAPRFQERGWKYLFRNVAFEAALETPGAYTSFKKACNVVWSRAPMFLNYHNEMAYLSPEKHLGKYGVFACTLPSAIGGYTLFADARRVHKRLRRALSQFPRAMRWVLARKKREKVPKRAKCGYLDFLMGKCELESVPDQFWPTHSIDELRSFCGRLDLELVEESEEQGGDYVIWSKWIEPSRQVPGTDEVSWWCNGNHIQVGSQGALVEKMKWLFKYDGGTERGASWSEIYSIALAYWCETIFFTWRAGDLIIFNNQILTHDASPGSGKRQILPTFGDCFC